MTMTVYHHTHDNDCISLHVWQWLYNNHYRHDNASMSYRYDNDITISMTTHLSTSSVVPHIHQAILIVIILLGVHKLLGEAFSKLDVVGTSSPQELPIGVLVADAGVAAAHVKLALRTRFRHTVHDPRWWYGVDVCSLSRFWKLKKFFLESRKMIGIALEQIIILINFIMKLC